MRLVCPNCGAQYEVGDRVIPEAGRDVQCSACGHGWYQMPLAVAGEGEEEIAAELAQAVPGEPGEGDEGLSEEELGEELAEEEPELEEGTFGESEDDELETGAPEAEFDTEFEPEEEEPFAPGETALPEEHGEEAEEPGGEAEEEPAAAGFAGMPPKRELDDNIKSILQEEAQREIEAREAEGGAGALETQPDLGVDEAPSPDEERRRTARERLARMRGLEDEDQPEAEFDEAAEAAMSGAEPAHRRDLFPDIEEINSTLDSHGQAAESPASGAAQGSSRGFRRGFFLMIFLAALLLILYLMAPQLADAVPALKPALAAYVETMNNLRAMLDDALKGLIEKINSLTQSA